MTYRAHLVGLCLAVGCFATLAPTRVNAQASAISPYFLVVVDNSGSMLTGTGGGNDSCGQAHTRINDARCVMQQVVNAYGDVEFGLMRYTEAETGTCAAPTSTFATCDTCGGGCNQAGTPGAGTCCTANGSVASRGQLLAPIVPHGGQAVERWADFVCTGGFDTGSNPELRAITATPIAGTTRAARSYFEGTNLFSVITGDACAAHASAATCGADVANNCAWAATAAACRIRSPLIPADPCPAHASQATCIADMQNVCAWTAATSTCARTGASTVDLCRPVALIFLTDGGETCASDAQTLAAIDELYNSSILGATRHIQSYWIGFGIAAGDAHIESFAAHGHTDAPGPFQGFYATDETSLALAFSQIIAGSIHSESCNGLDDDCDTLVDEGFTLYCNLPSHPAHDLCMAPAETLCDGVDNNCDGRTDEGLTNACGTFAQGGCMAPPIETCNNRDDDCDHLIDEGMVCMGCIPIGAETCDNHDEDCDGRIDEGVTAPCGFNAGRCTTGTMTCTAGAYGACSGLGPIAETCNGIDDDCDGTIDGEVQACGPTGGTCRQGSQICTMGMLGGCVGAIGPTTEICDGLDNNCNGAIDEGNPGGGGGCGSMIGSCTRGTYQCMAGALVCVGGSSGSAETCNNVDDDCDGLIDEGIASMGTCGTSSTGACSLGNRLCVAGTFTCVGAVGPTAELCDNLDNNCNGTVDEGNPEGGAMCGINVGACHAGTTQCMGGVLSCVGSIGPMPEVCNAIDDDCNGVVDDGIPVGAPCGSSMGECTPGVFVCDPASGMLTCQGGINGIPELCDTLDNDCDGAIDEDVGGGGACGTMVGACMQGVNQCVGGAITCVGEVPPTTETCDCADNDCDGTIDNPPTGGSLCPSGSACVMCQCASACMHSEFGDQCPDGTTPFTHDGVCSCVAPACDAATCGGQTVTSTAGTVECAPTSADGTVAPCICRNNGCTFACDGVTCATGLTCNPRTGACVENNCRGLGCPTGQLCNTTSGACEADPCATAGCTAAQACRAGTCEMPCASVTCTAGQTCHAGVCSTDRCAGVTCPMGRVCNPADGSCVINMCSGITCPTGQTCDSVAGGCHGDPCDTLHCPSGTMCQTGECVRSTTMIDGGPGHDAGPSATVDTGPVSRMDSGGATTDEHRRVLAGGGPLCSASVPQRDASGWRAMLGLLAIAGVWISRRRLGGQR